MTEVCRYCNGTGIEGIDRGERMMPHCDACEGSGEAPMGDPDEYSEEDSSHEFAVRLSEYGVAMAHRQSEKARVLAEVLQSMFDAATQPPQDEHGWRDLFWSVARALNCLPSTFVDGNAHVYKQAEKYAALAAAQPVAPSTLTDEQIDEGMDKSIMSAHEITAFGAGVRWAEKKRCALAASAPAQQAGPTTADIPRKDWQKRAIEVGFEYWRASDAHGVECTSAQAIGLLEDVLGVEVEIKDAKPPKCATCNDYGIIGGPSYYNPGEGGEPCPDCAPPQPVAAEVAILREALERIIKSRDERAFTKEEFRTDEHLPDGYWSPAASMVDSESIAHARNLLTALSSTGSDESKKGDNNG